MDKFEHGGLIKAGMYDDAWICGDDISETIIPYSSLIHDKINAEEYSEIINKLNSLGFTSFTLTSEQIEELLNKKVGD